MARVRVCLDLDIPPELERLISAAELSLEEVVRRAVERIVARELPSLGLSVAPAGSASRNEVGFIGTGIDQVEELDWRELVKLYVVNPSEARKRVRDSRIVRCLELLSRAVKRELEFVARIGKGSYTVVVVKSRDQHRAYALRLGSRYCIYRSIDTELDEESILEALKYVGLSTDEAREIARKIREKEPISIYDREKIEKAKERLILEREAFLNR